MTLLCTVCQAVREADKMQWYSFSQGQTPSTVGGEGCMPALHAFNWWQQLKALCACEARDVDEPKY